MTSSPVRDKSVNNTAWSVVYGFLKEEKKDIHNRACDRAMEGVINCLFAQHLVLNIYSNQQT